MSYGTQHPSYLPLLLSYLLLYLLLYFQTELILLWLLCTIGLSRTKTTFSPRDYNELTLSNSQGSSTNKSGLLDNNWYIPLFSPLQLFNAPGMWCKVGVVKRPHKSPHDLALCCSTRVNHLRHAEKWVLELLPSLLLLSTLSLSLYFTTGDVAIKSKPCLQSSGDRFIFLIKYYGV